MTDFSTTDLLPYDSLYERYHIPQQPNPFLYEEFAGSHGNAYLNTIVQQILSFAFWRTWQCTLSFSIPGQPLVVDAAQLAMQTKAGEHKIALDLQALEARQLLTTTFTRVQITQEDGTLVTRVLPARDFAGLYALAHDYYLWLQDPDFLPAERANVSSLQANPMLLSRLMRFDNYRRVFLCKKPGRKPASDVTTHQGERIIRFFYPDMSRASDSSITSHR